MIETPENPLSHNVGIQFFSVDETVNTFPWICKNHSKTFNHLNKAKEYLMGEYSCFAYSKLAALFLGSVYSKERAVKRQILPRGFRRRSSKISAVGGVLSIRFKSFRFDAKIWSAGACCVPLQTTCAPCSLPSDAGKLYLNKNSPRLLRGRVSILLRRWRG